MYRRNNRAVAVVWPREQCSILPASTVTRCAAAGTIACRCEQALDTKRLKKPPVPLTRRGGFERQTQGLPLGELGLERVSDVVFDILTGMVRARDRHRKAETRGSAGLGSAGLKVGPSSAIVGRGLEPGRRSPWAAGRRPKLSCPCVPDMTRGAADRHLRWEAAEAKHHPNASPLIALR